MITPWFLHNTMKCIMLFQTHTSQEEHFIACYILFAQSLTKLL